MIGLLIQFLVVVLVLAVFFYIAKLVVGYFGGPDIIVNILGLICCLILLIWLLNAIGLAGGGTGFLTPYRVR